MLWKSVFGAAAVGLILAGPTQAAQEAQNAGDSNNSAKSYQTFLSMTKTSGLSEVLGGNAEWDLSALMDRAFDSFGDGNADALQNLGGSDLAEVLTSIYCRVRHLTAWALPSCWNSSRETGRGS